MPKIFEYLGIVLFFYSNEHEPIHVHGRKGANESKAEFYIINGVIDEIKITSVTGKPPLKNNELKHFKEFLEAHSETIIEKWVDYFIFHKDVDFEKVNIKIR
jgi:hypothetical protein